MTDPSYFPKKSAFWPTRLMVMFFSYRMRLAFFGVFCATVLAAGCSGGSTSGIAAYSGIYEGQQLQAGFPPESLGTISIDSGGQVSWAAPNLFNNLGLAVELSGTLSETGKLTLDAVLGGIYTIRYTGQIVEGALGKGVYDGTVVYLIPNANNPAGNHLSWTATCVQNC